MRTEYNVSLASKTTMRIGGTAKKFYIPQTEQDLVELVSSLDDQGERFYVLSGGSNLLINDHAEFAHVIYCGEFDLSIDDLGEGRFYIGGSNRIQKIIITVNDAGYGGFEELVGLPALFGGIVYMNAGIGGLDRQRFCIADFILRVKVLDRKDHIVKWIDKDACHFSYRKSVFQNNDYIILGAEMTLYKQDKKQSEERVLARKQYCKKNQMWEKGCFGSLYSVFNGKLITIVYMLKKNSKGVYPSPKNYNWLLNRGNGTFKDAMSIIKLTNFLHTLFHKKAELEVRIWE